MLIEIDGKNGAEKRAAEKRAIPQNLEATVHSIKY